jgi:hypothetical protein
MTQNRESGAKAAESGHKTAAMIGAKLGANKLSPRSNEFELNGKRITIGRSLGYCVNRTDY